MAPEVMLQQNYSFASDYFAVGVVAYECMTGRLPFLGNTREEILQEVKTGQINLDLLQNEAADFVTKCLESDPSKRLGAINI